MKEETLLCKYCDKELSEEKGEIAHGCIDCCVNPLTEKLRYTNKTIDLQRQVIDKLVKVNKRFFPIVEGAVKDYHGAFNFCGSGFTNKAQYEAGYEFKARDFNEWDKLKKEIEVIKHLLEKLGINHE